MKRRLPSLVQRNMVRLAVDAERSRFDPVCVAPIAV